MEETTAQNNTKIRVAINGFGRIGRASFKILLTRPEVEVVAINDLTNPRVLAHLLKYDSAYGVYDKEVSLVEDGKTVDFSSYRGDKSFYDITAGETHLKVENNDVKVLSEPEPAKLPWEEMNIDVVLECTGRFVKDGVARSHIKAGSKKVILSAPAKGEGNVKTYMLGVNADSYEGEDLISNASCTTNCIAPITQLIKDNFGIEKSILTTIHAVTASQNIVDGPHKDMRRSRAANYNIIPTTTGAAIATTKVIPELKGSFDGLALRVPVLTGSISDLTYVLKKDVTTEEVNRVIEQESSTDRYKGIVGFSYEPLVSSDIVGSSFSSIVDLNMTKVVQGNLLKILAWYDNEWGYSTRLVDLAILISNNSRNDRFSIV